MKVGGRQTFAAIDSLALTLVRVDGVCNRCEWAIKGRVVECVATQIAGVCR